MFQLGKLADAADPAADRSARRPRRGSTSWPTNLPRFNNGTQQSLTSLGGAAHVGKAALANARTRSPRSTRPAPRPIPAADQVAKFLESIDNPNNAVEEDCLRPLRPPPAAGRGGPAGPGARPEARRSTLHGDQTALQVGERRAAGPSPNGGNPGYTGMEGLLNYAYVQTNSLNLFDQLGHALGITLVERPGQRTKRCGYQTGPDVPRGGESAAAAPPTSEELRRCAGILGDRQPGINYGT